MVVRVPFPKARGPSGPALERKTKQPEKKKTTTKNKKTKPKPKKPNNLKTPKPKEFPEASSFFWFTRLLFFSCPGWQAKLGASLSEKFLSHIGRLEGESWGQGFWTVSSLVGGCQVLVWKLAYGALGLHCLKCVDVCFVAGGFILLLLLF